MTQRYSEADLKEIGKQCGNKLPPASAVQAMFLYEMQRETELETLLQGQMFRLAKTEDHSKSLESKIWELEDQIKDLWQKVKSNDVKERLAASKVRTDALQSKISVHDQMFERQAERMAMLEQGLKDLEAKQADHKNSGAVQSMGICEAIQGTNTAFDGLAAVRSELVAMDEDVQTLFDERDGLITLLKQANERIDKLEDLVRALTLQNSTSGSTASSTSGSPPLSQLLPVQTKSGNTVELSVPKGKPLVPHKRQPVPVCLPGQSSPTQTQETSNVDLSVVLKGRTLSQHIDENIRPFTPGKQWMG